MRERGRQKEGERESERECLALSAVSASCAERGRPSCCSVAVQERRQSYWQLERQLEARMLPQIKVKLVLAMGSK